MRGLRPNQPHRFGENVGVSCCIREGVNDGMYVVQIPCTVAQRYAFYSDYLAGECLLMCCAPLLRSRGGALRKGGRSVQSAKNQALLRGEEGVEERIQHIVCRAKLEAHLELGARGGEGE